MSMRVRGKATARPDKVGGPTLHGSGVGGESPTVLKRCTGRAEPGGFFEAMF